MRAITRAGSRTGPERAGESRECTYREHGAVVRGRVARQRGGAGDATEAGEGGARRGGRDGHGVGGNNRHGGGEDGDVNGALLAIRPRPLDVEAGTRDAFGDAEARECPMTSGRSASEGHGVRACDRRFGERTTSRAGRQRGSSVIKKSRGGLGSEMLIAFADCLPVRKNSVLRIESDRGSHDSPAPVWRLLRLAFRRDPTQNHSTHTGRTRREEKERSKSLAESGVRFVTSDYLRFAVRAPSRTSRVAPRERHDAGPRCVRRHRARARPRPRIWARRSRPHAGPSRPEVRPRRRRAPGETLSSSRCAPPLAPASSR